MPKKAHNHQYRQQKKEKHHGRKSEASIPSQQGPAATAAGTATMTQAMMSGDSPDTHTRTDPLLELKERPVVACSSNGAPGKLAGETVTASVLVEPQPKQQDNTGVTVSPGDGTCPPNKRTHSTSTDDDTIETAATPLTNKKLDNGPLDMTDGDPTKLMNNAKKVPEDEEEEEGCGVKCLYYTLQCCECTIM